MHKFSHFCKIGFVCSIGRAVLSAACNAIWKNGGALALRRGRDIPEPWTGVPVQGTFGLLLAAHCSPAEASGTRLVGAVFLNGGLLRQRGEGSGRGVRTG